MYCFLKKATDAFCQQQHICEAQTLSLSAALLFIYHHPSVTDHKCRANHRMNLSCSDGAVLLTASLQQRCGPSVRRSGTVYFLEAFTVCTRGCHTGEADPTGPTSKEPQHVPFISRRFEVDLLVKADTFNRISACILLLLGRLRSCAVGGWVGSGLVFQLCPT